MFRYDRLKEGERLAKGEDHCRSGGAVFALAGLIRDGLIREPADMTKALTAGRSTGKRERVLIYAVNENFAINVGFDGVRGTANAVKHETLFQNDDVRAAGELEVDDGVIVEVGDVSGTYGTPGRIQTDPTFADVILQALDQISAPIERSERRRLERRAGRR